MSGKKHNKMRTTQKLKNPTRACFLVEMAEKVYGVDPLDRTGTRDNSRARAAVAIQLVQESETYHRIGFFFSKNHCTIAYYIKQHPTLMKFDKEYKTLYQDFLIEIGKPINRLEVTLQEIREQVNSFNKQLANLDYTSKEIQEFWNEVIKESRTKKTA